METIRIQQTVEKTGELFIQNLPLEEGQTVQILLFPQNQPNQGVRGTAKDLLESGLIGLWADRKEIDDSLEFAKQLREQSQNRPHIKNIANDNS